MKDVDNQALNHYWHTLRDECSDKNNPIAIDYNCTRAKQAKLELLESLSENISIPGTFNEWLKTECEKEDEDSLDFLFNIGYIYNLFDLESTKILSDIALKDWHHEAEQLVNIFELFPTTFTNEILYKMALQSYPNQYYGEIENVARKCIWALWRLNNDDATEKIRFLSYCGNPQVEQYAKHQLEKQR